METVRQKFEKAYREYAPNILKHIYLRVSDFNVAKDLTQDTFFKAWKSITKEEDKEVLNLKAFLYRIANNNVIDYYRKIKDSSLDEIEEVENIAIIEAEQGRDIDLKIEKEKLECCLSELKDDYRQVLIMRYIDDLNIKEISQVTGKKRGNVRILLFRALQSLKKKYGR